MTFEKPVRLRRCRVTGSDGKPAVLRLKDCVFRGCHTRGVLPGGLGVVRRAAGLSSSMLGMKSWPDVDSWIEAIRNSRPAFQQTVAWGS